MSAAGKLELRKAGSKDYVVLARLWHDSASLDGVGPPTMPSLEDLAARFVAEAASRWSITVAHVGQTTVGFLAVDLRAAVLDQLFIAPECLGSGVGTALFKRAQALMPSGFTLHTAITNDRARKFYERKGMVFTHESKHERTGHPVAHYVWRSA